MFTPGSNTTLGASGPKKAGRSAHEESSAEAAADASEERARRIVEAAYRLLEEGGLDGLTIRAVLKETGLARRAFYERFAGKDDLMVAVFKYSILGATRRYEQMFGSTPDPMERLKLIITTISMGEAMLVTDSPQAINRRGAALSREHLRLSEFRPEDLQAALQPLISLIAEQLALGMEQGKVRKEYSPQRLAVLVYNLVSTTAHKEFLSADLSENARERRAQLAADIWEFCRRAIAA